MKKENLPQKNMRFFVNFRLLGVKNGRRIGNEVKYCTERCKRNK
jgi:hypothetical protein